MESIFKDSKLVIDETENKAFFYVNGELIFGGEKDIVVAQTDGYFYAIEQSIAILKSVTETKVEIIGES